MAGLIFGLAVLALVLVVFLVLALRYPDVIREFFRGIVKVTISLTGITITRAMDPATRAVEQKEGRAPDRSRLREDLKGISPLGRVLWVDDHPDNNALEIEALKRLGLDVDTATNNDAAQAAVLQRQYDLVISDIGRSPPEQADAGLQLPGVLSTVMADAPRVLYYTGHAESPRTPDGHPVTDKPTELFELIRSEPSLRRGKR